MQIDILPYLVYHTGGKKKKKEEEEEITMA